MGKHLVLNFTHIHTILLQFTVLVERLVQGVAVRAVVDRV